LFGPECFVALQPFSRAARVLLRRGSISKECVVNRFRNRAPTGALLAAILTTSVAAQPPSTPRIAPLPESQWSESMREAQAVFESTGMRNLAATYANRPEVAEASLPHLAYLWTESVLPPRDRALLSLRTAWLTNSEYLWAHRAGLALREGLSEGDLVRVARGPDAGGWSEFDRLLLLAADEMHIDSFISDATWDGLSERYDTAQMIDTIDTAGALTMHAGAANSIGVRTEAGVAERFPAGLGHQAVAARTNIRLVDKAARIPPRAPQGGGPVTANVFGTFNHNPPGDRVRGQINMLVNNRMSLEPPHRELLLIRIGILTRSEYEYAAHMRVGLRVGLTETDIDDILAGPEAPADPVKAALIRATDELFEDDIVTAATWNELAETLSDGQMLDVLFAVGGYRSNSILISSAGVQLDANMADFRFPPELR
jgi:alkylhydroperoxidase family enzyme